MILFILILISAALLGFLFPWWAILPAIFILCLLLAKSLKQAVFISFFAVLILWLSLNLYYSLNNDHVLANRIAALFKLGNSSISWLWIVILSPLPGAICASLAGATGYFSKQLFVRK